MASDGFFLGAAVDPATGERNPDEQTRYDPTDLTTHGVIVGMTGSGKTGLGIIFLEEALLGGIPTLILDPKGDMTNLCLTFPGLEPADFEPWVDPGEARNEGVSTEELARQKAELWRNGLDSWGQDGERIRELREAADVTIYTPGSTAGTPIDIVGSLANPGLDWETAAETMRDEIQGFVTGLLGLTGIDADPITSREHILLSNIIEHEWRAGNDLDLATLLAHVQRPPMRKLGVFELDSFFPERDRTELALRINGLLASPSFASWTEGVPLDIGQLLWTADGSPRAAVLYLAHLAEPERQFVVTLVLSKMVTWMRAQSGTGDLRALVYMDEVFGFVPPTAEPPAKRSILTLLKQARAFGVGMLLSTQNPVDLDYKAMSNAGTWCVGRLQTERDKARILEALQSARGDTDVGVLDEAISGLGKRQFLLHNTHEPEPVLFTTRWALSFLRGPMTREQIAGLQQDVTPVRSAPQINQAPVPNAGAEAATELVQSAAGDRELAADETPVRPKVAEGVAVSYVDRAAPWLVDVGDPGSTRLHAAIAARVTLRYDETSADLVHDVEWEAIFPDPADPFDPDTVIAVDYDDRDLVGEAPQNAAYVIPSAPIENKSYWSGVQRAIRDHLYREATLTIYRSPDLDLYSRVDEDEAAFSVRADREAQTRADAEAAKLREKYETRIDRVSEQLRAAERRADELAVDLDGAKQQQMMDTAGAVIGVLLGRRSTRSITGSARSRKAARSKEARLRTAESKAADKAEELAELEQELLADLEEINDEWEERAEVIEQVEVRLEKNDIQVVDVGLVWVPR